MIRDRTAIRPRVRAGGALAATALIGACLVFASCSRGGSGAAAGSGAQSAGASGESAQGAPADSGAGVVAGVPVKVAAVERAGLDVIVRAPGHTEALRQDRMRAPFAARLVSLRVTDGDRVSAGQPIAELVAKSSEAALQGARSLLETAGTAQDSADARRALAIAEQNVVRQPLTSPAAGVVLSHAAETGDYVDEGEVLATIAEEGGVYFGADVPQGDLAGIRPGQEATIEMPATGGAVGAVVHGVLPAASSQNLSAPVRLDFTPPRPELTVGLFGTARIVIGRHEDAQVVPAGAVLRDDVTGASSVALIENGKAHWVKVETGIREGDRVEILQPPLPPGGQVVTEGLVGLPEGAAVRVEP
jgi:Cu(I)/Ag(I) efflux system membrane fusion protein